MLILMKMKTAMLAGALAAPILATAFAPAPPRDQDGALRLASTSFSYRAASDFSLEGFSVDGTTSPGPCGVSCANGEIPSGYPDPYYGTNGTGGIYSFHAGVANVLFGDASVRTLSATINIRTLGRLVTRAGGEVIAGTDF